MTQISQTVETPLRGQSLRNTIDGLVRELASRSPYSLVRLSQQWQGNRLMLTAEPHMVGAVTVRDGNPSVVALEMTLTSGLARGQAARVRSDIDSIAARLQQPTPTGVPTTTTTPTRRRTYDPARAERAATVFDAIARSFEQGVQSVFGRPAVPAPPVTIPDLPGRVPAVPGQLRPTGKPLPPGGAGYTAPLQPVYVERDVPWGLILAGGAVAVTGAVLLVKAVGRKDDDR
jgi:hypothetical protein